MYERLVTQMKKTLDFARVMYDNPGVETNLNQYMVNKILLIDLLRKHPDWNEDAMAVITQETAERVTSTAEVTLKCETLCMHMRDIGLHEAAECWEDGLWYGNWANRTLTAYMVGGILSTELARYVKPVEGQKTSRYLRSLFLKLGVPEDDSEFWQIYAELADALNPYSTTRPLIISVNPSDFLMMSYGTNWASCHIINPKISLGGESYHGAYKAGCISYMGDGTSIITYTVNKVPEDVTNLPITPRLTRQLFHYNTETTQLVQSRLYPYTDDENNIDVRRAIMQGVIATCLGEVSHWKKRIGCFGFGSVGLHYRDYEYHEKNHVTTTSLRGAAGSNEKLKTIGSTSYCLVCGSDELEEAEVICDECYLARCCSVCGEPIDLSDESSYVDVDGRNTHIECCQWCEYHQQYETRGDHYEVAGYGMVCGFALRIGEFAKILRIDGRTDYVLTENVGDGCIQIYESNIPTYLESEEAMVVHGYKRCAHCGQISAMWTMHTNYNNGEFFCTECVLNSKVVCASCGSARYSLLTEECTCGSTEVRERRADTFEF